MKLAQLRAGSPDCQSTHASGSELAQIPDDALRHEQRRVRVVVDGLPERPRLRLPEPLAELGGERSELLALAARVRVHIELLKGSDGLRAERADVLNGVVHAVLVRRADRRIVEPLFRELSGDLADDLLLAGSIEVAPFLGAVGFPPVGERLVQRLERAERDAVLVPIVEHDLREVVGEVVVVVGLQVVSTAATSGGAATVRHPIGW